MSPVANDLINYAYVMKPPKNPEGWDSESFRVGEHVEMLTQWCIWRDVDALCPFPTYLALCISSIWLVSKLYPFIINW